MNLCTAKWEGSSSINISEPSLVSSNVIISLAGQDRKPGREMPRNTFHISLLQGARRCCLVQVRRTCESSKRRGAELGCLFLLEERFADWLWPLCVTWSRCFLGWMIAFSRALVARIEALGGGISRQHCKLRTIHATKGLLVSGWMRTNPSHCGQYEFMACCVSVTFAASQPGA